LFPPGGFGTYFAFVDDTWRSVHLLFRIARIPHSTLRLGSICMDLRARVLGILEGDSFLASLGNVASDQIVRLSDCLSSHSLSVLADPRHSRLVRGGFGYSFLHKIPPDSPTPCFVFFSC